MQDANMKKAPSVRELSEKRTEGEKLALFKTLDKGNALSPPLRGTAYAARPLCRFATSPHTVGSHPPREGQCGLQPCKYYTTLLQYSHAVIRISNVTHCGGRCKFTGA